MLIGTTFAWFTDSVTSVSNVITAGNLDADVYYGDPTQENSVQGVSTLFNAVKYWEPGALAYENLTVANKGSLALKYRLTISFSGENYMLDGDFGLSEILMVGLVQGGIAADAKREEVLADVDEWLPMEDFSIDGELLAKTNDETLGLVIYWQPSSEDNNFNANNGKTTNDGEPLHIDLGVTLVATQLASESDSFDETYDEEATFPIVKSGTKLLGEHLLLDAGAIKVRIPKEALAGDYTLEVNRLTVDEDEYGNTFVDTDFTLKKDGQTVTPGAAIYDVIMEIDHMAHIISVHHKEDEIVNYDYDVYTGILQFQTDSFSPFYVKYDIFGEEVVLDENNRIHRGFFEGVNPVTLDATLLGDDSEYIAVDYIKNGVKHYAVSKRDTTLILGDADDGGEGYTFENGNYSVKMISDNRLYAEISALKSIDHSTVYILPGKYEESTTINVYSDMDIVGLGNAEDIQIIKIKGSYSNRHLINVNGAVSRAEHIEVTIRNLYLDATAKNLISGGKLYLTDNAAVQSIRLSKVKCYDLIIKKPSGFAFYVNGKYDARGAYLYAENCTMTTNSVVDTASTYRFYYNDLTYGKGEYKNNTSYIKNQILEWNDWDWVN
jgi:predicted ribosomally synthesized peptide with SipW-like signal peptide